MNAPDAPFDAPWQAQLFALTVALNEAGAFAWTEWAAVFGPRVRDVEADAYWEVWSETLVALLEDRGLATAAEVRALTARWQAAARATPHGRPIELAAAADRDHRHAADPPEIPADGPSATGRGRPRR